MRFRASQLMCVVKKFADRKHRPHEIANSKKKKKTNGFRTWIIIINATHLVLLFFALVLNPPAPISASAPARRPPFVWSAPVRRCTNLRRKQTAFISKSRVTNNKVSITCALILITWLQHHAESSSRIGVRFLDRRFVGDRTHSNGDVGQWRLAGKFHNFDLSAQRKRARNDVRKDGGVRTYSHLRSGRDESNRQKLQNHTRKHKKGIKFTTREQAINSHKWKISLKPQ